MKPSLAVGLSRSERITIDDERSISFLGEDLRTYSTPSMIRDIEMVCYRLIGEHTEEGESSVGVQVGIEHLGATPLGQWVDISARITSINKRRVTLQAEVHDAIERVGQGEHTRFVIDIDRHYKKLKEKVSKLGGD